MNQISIETTLANLPLGDIRYFESIGSTNDEAARWAAEGAADCSLVIADEQTAGRGRGARRWFTPPGAALAFSLILRPNLRSGEMPIARFTGLGALAVCRVLRNQYQLPAQIKWPNDVLVGERKIAGVLAEASWVGDQLTGVILGIGVNIATSAVPPADWPGHHENYFPAASVDDFSQVPLERLEFLAAILQELCNWYPQLGDMEFIEAWRSHLALRGSWVQIFTSGAAPQDARIIHLNEDGSLRVEYRSGEQVNLRAGEIHLRPVDSSLK